MESANLQDHRDPPTEAGPTPSPTYVTPVTVLLEGSRETAPRARGS